MPNGSAPDLVDAASLGVLQGPAWCMCGRGGKPFSRATAREHSWMRQYDNVVQIVALQVLSP